MGLSTTLNRELARLSVLPEKVQEMRNLERTLEIIYWGVAIFISFVIITLSAPIVYYWVKADAQTVAPDGYLKCTKDSLN